MKFKNFMEWIDNNPRVREKYDGSSFTSAHYLIEYCDGRANALRDLGIEDEIIDHLMNESGATDREFFENQDSVVLCKLCSYDWLRDFVNEKMNEVYDEEYEELIDETVDEIQDYAEKEMIVFDSNDREGLSQFVFKYMYDKDYDIPGSHTYTEFFEEVVDRIS